jgi:ribosomal protein S18 acetylase RimI-like enzyme
MDRISLFEKHGFTAARYSYTMQRDLEKLPTAAALPPNVELLPWDPVLDGAVMHAFNVAFRGQWGVPQLTPELWREFFTGVPQFRPELSCMALAGGEVVGFCINWVTQPRQGWVEAVGVLPEWRGKGLASALLAHSLNAFGKAGLTRAALDVDAENPTGALRLYKKLGFEAVKEEVHFVKQLT